MKLIISAISVSMLALGSATAALIETPAADSATTIDTSLDLEDDYDYSDMYNEGYDIETATIMMQSVQQTEDGTSVILANEEQVGIFDIPLPAEIDDTNETGNEYNVDEVEKDGNDNGRELMSGPGFFYNKYHGACRTPGPHGSNHGRPGVHFTRYTHKSLNWCMNKCSSTSRCKAFEYYAHGRQCEIWFQWHGHYEKHNGFFCYSKHFF